ncbi:DUF4349 domain-containing protein [Streptomyces sp. NBC_00343]|uniref:DUF4349 domain-containing protein n=1 Tax=Streptomyces sp. NBC_00343 TaxID=2975719 RepID=UPI002E294021|nr:DUF4349 domain-containing protein [Streptomyces sp. NBC_00343]
MRAHHSLRPVQALAGLLLASALALAGCGGGASEKSAGDSGAGAADKAAAPEARQEGASGSGNARNTKAVPELTASSIIRTASLSVRVKDVPRALDEARTTTENAGGFVGDESTSRDGQGHERTRVVLRVPSDRYDAVLADLEGTGKLLDRTAKAQDVTDQVVDVESRIASQRASVARVRELMDRATKLSDVVELEGELSTRESDLEALLAQQASLKDRTSLATITLSLSQTPVAKAAAKDDGPGFVDAVAGGWHVFVTMLRWIALSLGAVLPFAAVAALALLVWLRLVRPRRVATVPAATGVGPLPAARPVRPEEEGGQD